MMNRGKEKPQLQFPLCRRQYPSFAAPNACSDALSSSSAIAKANSDTDAPPTAETPEVNLMLHEPQNPRTPPHASTSASSGVPAIVTQGGSSVSSNAATTNNVADDGQLQGMPYSSSVQIVSVLREGMKDMTIRATKLMVEASIMCCFQIDSSKFMRDPLEQLLPRNMEKAKKIRLLITARDKDVRNLFVMRCLLKTDAMGLLKNGLYNETNDKEKQINSSHIKQDG